MGRLFKKLLELIFKRKPIKKPPKAPPKKPPSCKQNCKPKPSKNPYTNWSKEEIEKAIKSEKDLIKEHQQKLADYKRDPLKFDNKDTLKNAKDAETYNKIIQGRVKKLENDIRKHERELEKLKEAINP